MGHAGYHPAPKYEDNRLDYALTLKEAMKLLGQSVIYSYHLC